MKDMNNGSVQTGLSYEAKCKQKKPVEETKNQRPKVLKEKAYSGDKPGKFTIK